MKRVGSSLEDQRPFFAYLYPTQCSRSWILTDCKKTNHQSPSAFPRSKSTSKDQNQPAEQEGEGKKTGEDHRREEEDRSFTQAPKRRRTDGRKGGNLPDDARRRG